MWEYYVYYMPYTAPRGKFLGVDINRNVAQFLEWAGNEGWELVSASPSVYMGTYQGDVLYFKRLKKEQQKEGN